MTEGLENTGSGGGRSQDSSPSAHRRCDRGSARRARGLKKYPQKKQRQALTSFPFEVSPKEKCNSHSPEKSSLSGRLETF